MKKSQINSQLTPGLGAGEVPVYGGNNPAAAFRQSHLSPSHPFIQDTRLEPYYVERLAKGFGAGGQPPPPSPPANADINTALAWINAAPTNYPSLAQVQAYQAALNTVFEDASLQVFTFSNYSGYFGIGTAQQVQADMLAVSQGGVTTPILTIASWATGGTLGLAQQTAGIRSLLNELAQSRAQLQSFQQQVQNLSGQIATLTQQLQGAALAPQVADLQNQIAALTQQLTDAQNQLADMQSQVQAANAAASAAADVCLPNAQGGAPGGPGGP